MGWQYLGENSSLGFLDAVQGYEKCHITDAPYQKYSLKPQEHTIHYLGGPEKYLEKQGNPQGTLPAWEKTALVLES